MESIRLKQSFEKIQEIHAMSQERIEYLESEVKRLSEDRAYLLIGIIVITLLAFWHGHI